MQPDPEGRLADVRRRRRQAISGMAMALAGVGVVAAAVVWALGWWPLVVGLILIGTGTVIAAAFPGPRRGLRLGAAALAAAIVVAAGVSAVRLEPWSAPGWAVEDDERLLGHAGGVAVTVDDDGLLRGRDISSGNQAWEAADSGITGGHAAVARGDELIFSPGGGSPAEESVVVLDAVSGVVRWAEDVGRARLVRVTDQTLVFNAPSTQPEDRSVLALDRAEGIVRWQATGAIAPPSHGQASVSGDAVIVGDRWAFLEGARDEDTYAVVDLDSGVRSTAVPRHPALLLNWEVVEDVLVQVGSHESGSAVTAHSTDGEVLWEEILPIQDVRWHDTVAGDVRVVGTGGVAMLDGRTGAGELREWPDGVRSSVSRITRPGEPWLVATSDEDGETAFLLNASTWELIDLREEFPVVRDAYLTGHSGGLSQPISGEERDRTVLQVNVSDAVGAPHTAYAILDDNGLGPFLVIDENAGVTGFDGLVQVGNRIVPLRAPAA